MELQENVYAFIIDTLSTSQVTVENASPLTDGRKLSIAYNITDIGTAEMILTMSYPDSEWGDEEGDNAILTVVIPPNLGDDEIPFKDNQDIMNRLHEAITTRADAQTRIKSGIKWMLDKTASLLPEGDDSIDIRYPDDVFLVDFNNIMVFIEKAM